MSLTNPPNETAQALIGTLFEAIDGQGNLSPNEFVSTAELGFLIDTQGSIVGEHISLSQVQKFLGELRNNPNLDISALDRFDVGPKDGYLDLAELQTMFSEYHPLDPRPSVYCKP